MHMLGELNNVFVNSVYSTRLASAISALFPLDTMNDTQGKPKVLYLGAPKHASDSIRGEYAHSFDIDVSASHPTEYRY